MKYRLLIIILFLSSSGCSLMYSYSENLPQKINQWIKEHKYNTALETISYIKPNHKDYKIIQRQKSIILKKIPSYESNGIKKSNELAAQGEWLLALKHLDTIADNIVNSKKIEKQRALLLKKRSKVIENYEYEVLLLQATDITQKLDLYTKIKKTVKKSESNNLNIVEFDELRYETSLNLTDLSEQQLKNGQYEETKKTTTIALKLAEEKEIVDRLQVVNKQIKKDTKLKNLAYIEAAQLLQNKLSQGYSHTILKKTKETLIWFNKNSEYAKNNESLVKKLKNHLAGGMKQNFQAGRKLYSEGKTQQALSIWIQLNEIDPEYPKLQTYITRAEKVVRKLKKLSNKPAKK